MLTELKRGILFTLVTIVLLGGGYHVVCGGSAAAFSDAGGRQPDPARGWHHRWIRLIAQKFTRPEYFQSRPSGVDYNAASTGGTNYGPQIRII
jgi:K+-transporting ATPase ATPase C chain